MEHIEMPTKRQPAQKNQPVPTTLTETTHSYMQRPKINGKFIYIGDEKFWVRGVTYGAFRPDENGNEFHDKEKIEKDFEKMAANGLNAVRIPHTTPPRYLLDIAQKYGLRVMIGLSAEQYIGYLIDKKDARDTAGLVRNKVKSCKKHPALLCYGIGNEIAPSVARWLGRKKVERYIERLYHVVKSEDPEGLVTYVNYPTTEYLQLPFLDFVSFNVYLESEDRLKSYLGRLQNMAGERPLLMTEMGLDSLRNGEDLQARSLLWQIRTAFSSGCAGTFVFAWTDEWYKDGEDVSDWFFGIIDKERRPKPALSSVQRAFLELPFTVDENWPAISVVICSYNGSRTIRKTLEALNKITYPNFEVIVVNDGSTDRTALVASEFNVRLISTKNEGLSSARNLGYRAASGGIVAYIDDDAYPDPDWLRYLAHTFMTTSYAAVGGPNIPPPDNGMIAECIGKSPGNPTHVLLSDQEAEHIPGVNMAFRKSVLEAIGGFDHRFRTAGDDVDICWRIQQKGWKIGYNPAAMVWHQRRNSLKAYLKQQMGYGKAEALLEGKWPEKYNKIGHLNWKGRIYSDGITNALVPRPWRIYHGMWGSAPFQSLYEREPGTILSLPLMPEWYLIILLLAVLSLIGTLWGPLFSSFPLLIAAVTIPIIQAVRSAKHASFTGQLSAFERFKRRTLTAFLHLVQPLGRLIGRLRNGLAPWRHCKAPSFTFPRRNSFKQWSNSWLEPEKRIKEIETVLKQQGVMVIRGGEYDRWDLEIRGGLFGSVRLQAAIEDQNGGQLIRYRSWPKCSVRMLLLIILFFALSIGAAIDQARVGSAILGVIGVIFLFLTLYECGVTLALVLRVLKQAGSGEEL